jgi:hypothetical protein
MNVDVPQDMHEGLPIEERAKHGALEMTQTISDIAKLHRDGDNFAKRLLGGWFTYLLRTNLGPASDQNAKWEESVQTPTPTLPHKGGGGKRNSGLHNLWAKQPLGG